MGAAADALGNITSKTGQGTYTYHATRKHAVVSTSGGGSYGYDANGNMTSRNGGTLTWYSFNLPNIITSGSSSSQFFYAPDGGRYKQVASYSGTTETTLYVGGLLEKMTRSGVTEYRHAILAGGAHTVIYTRRSDGTNSTYHVTRDHLGSTSAVTDAAGNLLVNESFNAFGERRGSNWTGTPSAGDLAQIAAIERRGFTDHEHLDNLNLIHMNGRVYDPTLGRFISADPFIDGWGNTQGITATATSRTVRCGLSIRAGSTRPIRNGSRLTAKGTSATRRLRLTRILLHRLLRLRRRRLLRPPPLPTSRRPWTAGPEHHSRTPCRDIPASASAIRRLLWAAREVPMCRRARMNARSRSMR